MRRIVAEAIELFAERYNTITVVFCHVAIDFYILLCCDRKLGLVEKTWTWRVIDRKLVRLTWFHAFRET